jgi:hypothetical protein
MLHWMFLYADNGLNATLDVSMCRQMLQQYNEHRIFLKTLYDFIFNISCISWKNLYDMYVMLL